MVTLAPRALRLLDAAIEQLGDDHRTGKWAAWRKSHREIARSPGERWDDFGQSAFPADIVETALLALGCWAGGLRERRGRFGLSEDEVSDLDNQLSYVQSVERFLTAAPTKTNKVRRTG
jgi:hypothetical protein